MDNWKEMFEEKFVADGILDCIPTKNWEEMKEEVFGFIWAEKEKSFREGYKMATDNTGWKTTEGASENPHNNFTRKKDGKESKGIW